MAVITSALSILVLGGSGCATVNTPVINNVTDDGLIARITWGPYNSGSYGTDSGTMRIQFSEVAPGYVWQPAGTAVGDLTAINFFDHNHGVVSASDLYYRIRAEYGECVSEWSPIYTVPMVPP